MTGEQLCVHIQFVRGEQLDFSKAISKRAEGRGVSGTTRVKVCTLSRLFRDFTSYVSKQSLRNVAAYLSKTRYERRALPQSLYDQARKINCSIYGAEKALNDPYRRLNPTTDKIKRRFHQLNKMIGWARQNMSHYLCLWMTTKHLHRSRKECESSLTN